MTAQILSNRDEESGRLWGRVCKGTKEGWLTFRLWNTQNLFSHCKLREKSKYIKHSLSQISFHMQKLEIKQIKNISYALA